MVIVKPPALARLLYRKAVWKIPTCEKAIYLTFDDGPSKEITPAVLDALKKYRAAATFFCIGKNAESNPEIYNRVIAEGHATGNHTYSHLNSWKNPAEKFLNDVERCSAVVDSAMFRPPFGKLMPAHYSVLAKRFFIIMWDVLTGDFDQGTGKEKCLKNALTFTGKGSVVVFHDSPKAEKNIGYALPRLLEHFSEKGYAFKPIVFPKQFP